ncbi:hypothetical protein SDC9_97402 [bioreactor metagenome]|uniref:Uncharacterized protein n=1 Tax=bioreactor metagenome TaxID=1076179 RepID=A0A645ABW5_9ZZZZ
MNGGSQRAEQFVFHGITGQNCHIARGGILAALIRAAGVDEIRVRHAKLCCFLVHKLRKAFHAAAEGQRQHERRIVARFQHQSVKKLAHGELFAADNAHKRVCILHARGLAGNRYLLLQIGAKFNAHNAGHDFHRAARDAFIVRISLVENDCGIVLIHNNAVGHLQIFQRVCFFRECTARPQQGKRQKRDDEQSTENSSHFMYSVLFIHPYFSMTRNICKRGIRLCVDCFPCSRHRL